MDRGRTCADCETYRTWLYGSVGYSDELIVAPNPGSGIPESYRYCAAARAVVDMDASPEDNCCFEFEEARR